MAQKAYKNFLDDTSLLSTPNSPMHTSTATKENRKLMCGKQEMMASFIEDIFNKPSEKSKLPLGEITNLATNSFMKELDYTLNRHKNSLSSIQNDSSLGILSLDRMSAFSFNEEPVRLPKESDGSVSNSNKPSVTKNTTYNADRPTISINSQESNGFVPKNVMSQHDVSNVKESSKNITYNPNEKKKELVNLRKKDTELFLPKNNETQTGWLLRTPGASNYTYSESYSPSVTHGQFADISSFQVNDIYKVVDNCSNISQKSFAFDESKVSFCIDQISARSSSLSSSRKDITHSKEIGEIVTNSGGDLTESTNVLEEFKNQKQSFQDSDFSAEEFLSDEAAKNMILDEKELEFKKEQKLMIGDNESKFDQMSLWSISSQNNFVKRPSWWSEATDDTQSQLSVSRLIAARTECLGSLNNDENKEHPFFGNFKKSCDTINETSINSNALLETKDKLSSVCTSSAAITNPQPDLSYISKFVAEMSLSDDLSVIGNKFLANHAQKEGKVNRDTVLIHKNETQQLSVHQNKTINIKSPSRQLQIPVVNEPQNSLNSLSPVKVTTNNCTKISVISNEASSCNSCNMISPINLNASNCSTKISSVSHEAPSHNSCSGLHSQCSRNKSGSCYSCVSNFSGCYDMYMKTMLQNQHFLGATYPPPPPQDHFAGFNFSSTMPMFQFGMPGVSTCSAVIIGPTEITHPIMCIGDSQKTSFELQNPMNIPLYYHFSITQAMLNDTAILVDSVGIIVPKFVYANPASSVNIPLEFVPKLQGKFKLVLQAVASVYPTLGNQSSTIGLPFIVKVSLEVENPSISLLYEEKERLDLLSVKEQSTVKKFITLSNLGQASVPLRLTINNGCNENHIFSFGTQNFKITTDQTSTTEFYYLSPQFILCRLSGQNDPDQKSIQIPLVFHAGKCKTSQKEETVISIISATTECKVFNNMVWSLRVSAVVGVVKFSIVYPYKSLLLQTEEGSKAANSLKLINAGSLPCSIDLAVISETDEFYVEPPSLNLEPQREIMISVWFKPRSFYSSNSTNLIKGMLQVATIPDGETFDLISVEGYIIGKRKLLKEKIYGLSKSNEVVKGGRIFNVSTIHANRTYLSWIGTRVGEEIIKTVVMRNASKQLYKAVLSIKEKDNIFQIVDENNKRVQEISVEFKGQSDNIFQISFMPKESRAYATQLIMKIDESCNFRIPLNGYGGTCDVQFLNLNSDIPQVQLVSAEDNLAHATVVLCNKGSQPAYVAAIGEENLLEENELIIEPSNFILLPDEHKTIFIKYQFLNAFSWEDKQKCGSIIFYYGDEILRQKFQVSKEQILPPISDIFLQKIDFKVPFLNDKLIKKDKKYLDSRADSSQFYHFMKKLSLGLIHAKSKTSFNSTNSFTVLLPDASMMSNDSTILSNNRSSTNLFCK